MEFDIVINGGGLVGASLATALKSSGLKIALVEGQALPELDSDWDSRIYAFTPGNVDFLKEIGAWQRVDMARVQQVEEMRVFGDTGAKLDFSAYQAGASELAFILESRLLQHALWLGLREQENLTILQPAQCAELNINDEAAHLKLKDGREIKTRLIVGADGRDSWVRNHPTFSTEWSPTSTPAKRIAASLTNGSRRKASLRCCRYRESASPSCGRSARKNPPNCWRSLPKHSPRKWLMRPNTPWETCKSSPLPPRSRCVC
jgi:2-polyprenyl-6-methoxyphenol hydroxylase-like FAD-dependent oxidoreductase